MRVNVGFSFSFFHDTLVIFGLTVGLILLIVFQPCLHAVQFTLILIWNVFVADMLMCRGCFHLLIEMYRIALRLRC